MFLIGLRQQHHRCQYHQNLGQEDLGPIMVDHGRPIMVDLGRDQQTRDPDLHQQRKDKDLDLLRAEGEIEEIEEALLRIFLQDHQAKLE